MSPPSTAVDCLPRIVQGFLNDQSRHLDLPEPRKVLSSLTRSAVPDAYQQAALTNCIASRDAWLSWFLEPARRGEAKREFGEPERAMPELPPQL